MHCVVSSGACFCLCFLVCICLWLFSAGLRLCLCHCACLCLGPRLCVPVSVDVSVSVSVRVCVCACRRATVHVWLALPLCRPSSERGAPREDRGTPAAPRGPGRHETIDAADFAGSTAENLTRYAAPQTPTGAATQRECLEERLRFQREGTHSTARGRSSLQCVASSQYDVGVCVYSCWCLAGCAARGRLRRTA